MYERRTDLAAEAHQLWQQSAQQTTELEGVTAEERVIEGFSVEKIDILNRAGEQALGRPRGHYITAYLTGLLRREGDAFPRAVRAVAQLLGPLLPPEEDAPVLVIGLGNRGMIPDAVGPMAVERTLVTRHLREQLPDQFGEFRPVSALSPGVLGTTGVESGDIAKAMAGVVKPAAVIAIDALAGRSLTRLCSTIQMADTGITPGSGIGNRRAGLNRQTLGVPVVAIGVPTVVEAGTLALDLLESAGQTSPASPLEVDGAELIVTPKDIDRTVADIAKVIGYGISLALHPQLDMAQLDLLLS